MAKLKGEKVIPWSLFTKRKTTSLAMRRYLSCVIICFALILSFCILAACDIMTYRGENKDLAAATIFSIPGTDVDRDSQFLILDRDQYGRTLFGVFLAYADYHFDDNPIGNSQAAVLAIIITQKNDDAYVYFYPEDNYRMRLLSSYLRLNAENVGKYFSDAEINGLKEDNDWGKPPDESASSAKVPIVISKESDIPKATIDSINETIGVDLYPELLREDKEGKRVCFSSNKIKIDDEQKRYEYYFVLLNSNWELVNGEAGILKINALETMPQELKEFLKANNWVEITQ